MKDYYDILGLTDNERKLQGKDFDKVLKKRYRICAIENHPDKNPGNKEAEAKFKEVAEAYRVLSAKNLRERYDTYGTIDPGMNGMGMNPNDIFANFLKMHHGFGFGFDEEPQERVFKGRDKSINVTFKEVYNNATKDVTYTVNRKCAKCNGSGSKNGRIENCSHCNGTGQIHNRRQYGNIISEDVTTCPYCGGLGKVVRDKCTECGGTGLVETKETLTIEVPTIYDVIHQSYTNEGKGHTCANGLGINGDLRITFNLVNDEDYELDQNNILNIIKTVKVPIIDCLLGTSLSVKHLDDKKYTITINECTPNGKMYKMQGKGFKVGHYVGDLFIKIEYIMPKALTQDDRKKLKKLKESKTFN